MAENVKESVKIKNNLRRRIPQRSKFMEKTRLTFFLLSILKVVPLKWSAKKQAFQRLLSIYSWQWIVFIASILIVSIECSFVLFRMFQTAILNWPISKNKDALRGTLSLFSQLSSRAVTLICSVIVLPTRDNANFVNQLIAIRRRENLNADYPGAKIFLFTFTIRCLQTAVLSYSKPNKYGFWYSALPDSWKQNPRIFGLHWLFHLRVATMFFCCLFVVINMLLYLHTLAHLLQRGENLRRYSLKARLLWYREVQVLSTEFAQVYGSLAVPYFTWHSWLVSVILAFGSLRYFNDLDLRVYIQMPMSLSIILAFDVAFYSRAGRLPKLSAAASKRWFGVYREANQKEYWRNRMYKRSCRVLMIGDIRRTFVLALFRFILTKTLRLLILTDRLD